MEEITVYIEDREGKERELRIPVGISMSLMEALKAYDEPIEATCGGMALCASCRIQVLNRSDGLGERTADEEAMLDTLPELTETCRLSCQIPVSKDLHGIRIRYAEQVYA